MKNKILIALFIAFGLSFFSCQKTGDFSKIEDSFTLKRNGAEMPTYVFGNAQSKVFVLILHGGPGGEALSLRNDEWNTQLEEKYAMVYWDQRGSGMSQGRLTAENLNFAEMKKDVLALVALLKHKYGDDITLFLLGQSWGTMLGGGVLADDNNQNLFNGYISSASVYDWCNTLSDLIPAYTQIANDQIAANNDVDFWNEMLDIAADTDTTNCDDVRLNNKGNSATEKLENQGLIVKTGSRFASAFYINNIITTIVTKSNTNNFLFDNFPYEDYDLTNKLPNITIPTIVLHGKYDLYVALKTGQTYFDLLGSSDKTFYQFDQSGHGIFENETEEFGDKIVDFIEANK